jgi:hypothetical protein
LYSSISAFRCATDKAMLPVLELCFQFLAPEGFRQSAFAEAAWRGAFGYALRRAVCLTRLRACTGCAYEFSCAYPFIFETRPNPATSLMRGADRTPHPYILRVPGGDGRVQLEMVLVGTATRHLSSVIHAVGEAARRGIGAGRPSLTLESVVDPEGVEIWRPGSNLSPVEPRSPVLGGLRLGSTRVTLVSPLRLVLRGDPIPPAVLDGPTLAFAAVRRVGLLADCFGGGADRDGTPMDFKALKAESKTVAILERNLGWADRRRFSTRQARLITYGGLTGDVTLDLSQAPGVAACLETCETVHLGKGATFGFGRIALAAA